MSRSQGRVGPLRESRGLGPSDVSVPLGLSWTISFPSWALLGSLRVSGSKPLWSNALFIPPSEPGRACPSTWAFLPELRAGHTSCARHPCTHTTGPAHTCPPRTAARAHTAHVDTRHRSTRVAQTTLYPTACGRIPPPLPPLCKDTCHRIRTDSDNPGPSRHYTCKHTFLHGVPATDSGKEEGDALVGPQSGLCGQCAEGFGGNVRRKTGAREASCRRSDGGCWSFLEPQAHGAGICPPRPSRRPQTQSAWGTGLAGRFSAPSGCSVRLRAAGGLRVLPGSRSSAAYTRGVP